MTLASRVGERRTTMKVDPPRVCPPGEGIRRAVAGLLVAAPVPPGRQGAI